MADNLNRLNELVSYIENNLDKEIDNEKMAQILCVNNYTLQRIFKFITGISVSEYIRNRRLSIAAIELLNSNCRIIDLAVKYGYSSSDGFSRAFTKFHGVTPKNARKNTDYLKNYPPYSFSEIKFNKELNYKIEHHDGFTLNGISFEADLYDIHILAPKFWDKLVSNPCYSDALKKHIAYGILKYDELFPKPLKGTYYIASNELLKDSTPISLPECDWAIFDIEETTGDYFYNFANYVYANWIPYSGFNIKNVPEVEVYYGDHTEWWLPIEKQ